MSINNSYFSKNNTIISNSLTNTGRNPVTELFYGALATTQYPNGYSRFIFDLDLTLLKQKINDGTISTTCTDAIRHTLRMVNTSTFNPESLNTTTSQARLRATSFDLILFRIPPVVNTIIAQSWDEGVGYDFADLIYDYSNSDKNFSTRPSNWIQTTTLNNWSEPGIYNNKNNGTFNFDELTIVDRQHFQFGNENISFDMTQEIKDLLNGDIRTSGWGIAYLPQIENLTGLTSNYEVQFFTKHTQTFYEPYLETSYDDLIEDDRNSFSLGKVNKLYLYIFENGNPINLDELPLVCISDSNGTPILGLISPYLQVCQRTKGVYEVTIPPLIGYKTPCSFYDIWSGLKLNGFSLPDITNDFVLYPLKRTIQIGTSSVDPKVYGFDFYGLKQDEKIYNTDIRKVGVVIKQAYTTNKILPNVEAYYRVYVREGQTEVQVQDWTKINRTPNEYYFMFDTRDKIPNEYYVDMKVISSGEVNTYKRQIKFQIVNVKYSE
jgi:hypothetical protein